jgi:CheY-like chemotaxis protein
LTFARQSDEKLSPLKVSLPAKEALKFLRSSIPTTIEIKQNIESNSLIMGNPTQLHQIFMNLCTNAAQAMEKKGGILEVDLRDVQLDENFTQQYPDLEPGRYIKISVSDEGAGIPPASQDSIFEPYYTTKAPGEGTGMGLAIVHGIVKSYGGEITMESKVGKGTVFTIYLPVIKARSESHPYEKDTPFFGNERVLFVDDEDPIARMGSRILEQLGYSVTTRTSSLEALELFRAKPDDFDLVITDMTMPNMSGDKLATQLMAIRPDIPVILCTGYSKNISDDSAAKLGIKAVVYKPVARVDLAKIVRKILGPGRPTLPPGEPKP